jgi:hypothetical protein
MCVQIEFVEKDEKERLIAVGGSNNPEGWNFFGRIDWGEWVQPIDDVVALIESGTWEFFVIVKAPRRGGAKRVAVVVASRFGRKYIKTVRDDVTPNNLLALPARPPSPPANYSLPGLPVALPPARMPGQPKIYSRGKEVALSQSGLYAVLPAKGVRVVVVAPWPGDLEVSVNGQALERDYTSATSRPDLEAQGLGWYRPTLKMETIDRDATVWDLEITLPLLARSSGFVTLSIAHVSMNPLCVDHKSPPLVLALASPSFISPPTPPPAKTGTERVSLGLVEGAPNYPFAWAGTGIEAGAVVTSVRNVSLTVETGDLAQRLSNVITLIVTHAGRTTTIPPLGATTIFDGTGVTGGWAGTATNLSAVFLIKPGEAGTSLDRARCALDVSWRKP